MTARDVPKVGCAMDGIATDVYWHSEGMHE